VTSPVEVRIDELVLDGLEPRAAAALPDLLEKELTRLLARHGPALRSGRVDRVAAALGWEPTGERIAQAVYEGISRCST
jgi:hypothetical protein